MSSARRFLFIHSSKLCRLCTQVPHLRFGRTYLAAGRRWEDFCRMRTFPCLLWNPAVTSKSTSFGQFHTFCNLSVTLFLSFWHLTISNGRMRRLLHCFDTWHDMYVHTVCFC